MNPNLARLYDYPFTRLRALLNGSSPAGDNAISLSVGEPQHPPPGFVLEALTGALDGLQRYPATQGSEPLRDAIANWLCRRYQLPGSAVDPASQVLPVQGTREALFAAAQFIVAGQSSSNNNSIANNNALVAMPSPFYQIYEGAAFMAGAQPLYLPCTSANGFKPDLNAVTEAQWKRCQLFYICNPSNPTGTVYDSSFYAQLLSLADRYDFIVASDECYSEIYLDEDKPTPGLLQVCSALGRDKYERCLVFNSLSKRSNLAGLRSGFVVGDANLITAFLRYRTYHGSAMPLHHQAASIVAWQDEEHVIKNRARYRDKILRSSEVLGDRLEFELPAGGFCLWANCGGDDEQFALALYREKGVTVLPGSYLARDTNGENPASGYLRLALVQPLEQCLEAAIRICDYIDAKA
ncbi:MAG: succinyldiaminopimelate transaminase [Gammaproteobacteria bacterium]|nr:succinyldiaminopimelate transaminase [Gammaproteobacteria bacterium]